MTPKERQLLEAIRKDPMISQNDLAETLGISRAAVSVHISHLMKKGYIAGRGYMLNEEPYTLVIGAANVDIVGHAQHDLIMMDSNVGAIQTSPGGVGRNIAENLCRLYVDTKFIAALGDDAFGETIRKSSEAVGVDMQHCCVLPDKRTSLYMALLGTDGEMAVGIANMATAELLPLEHIQKKRALIERATCVVLECNLPSSILGAAIECCRSPIYLDAVSTTKVARAKPFLRHIDTIKLNLIEATALTGVAIDPAVIGDSASGFEPLKQAAQRLHDTGLRRVFITLGERGVFWSTERVAAYLPSPPVRLVNATGAGDAFMAGLVYAELHDAKEAIAVRHGAALARIALASKQTVSDLVTPKYLAEQMAAEPQLEVQYV